MLGSSYSTGSGRRLSETLAAYTEQSFIPRLSQALYAEGSGILAASVGLVPVDTGALRASGYVTEPAMEENSLIVYIGYGGTASQSFKIPLIRGSFKIGGRGSKVSGRTFKDVMKAAERDPSKYAIYVHENLEAHHPVGMAKFLEIPFVQAKAGMDGRIADFMAKGIMPGVAAGAAGPDIDYGDLVT